MTHKVQQLGDLQLAILGVLWPRGEATVREVHEALQPERSLAPTTVATMLTKMEAREIVAHRVEGRRFVYRPLVSERQVRRSMVGRLTDRLFAGDPLAVVSHLLSEHDIRSAELERLRRLIAERELEEDAS